MNKIPIKTKFIFTLFLFLSFSYIPLNAMIREISLEELIDKSDVIAIVDVLAIKEVGTLPYGAKLIANLVKVDQPLMGRVAVGEKLKLKTRGIEDEPIFKKGMRVLLFLKDEKKYYEIVSGVAGSWPITKSGKIIGYGMGKNMSEVEKTIERIEREKRLGIYTPKKTEVSSSTRKIAIPSNKVPFFKMLSK